MLVRDAVPDDADEIAALNAAAWRQAFAAVVSEDYLAHYDGAPGRRRASLLAPAAGAVQLVAVDGTDVVGWVAGFPSEDDDCDPRTVFEVNACYVAPSHWRRGVGRRLLQDLLAGLERPRWQEAVLWTPRDTAPTRAFYAAMGFEPDGSERVMDRGGPLAIVRLRRTLGVVRARPR